jgi:phage-related protein
MAGLPYLVEAVRIYGGVVANVLAPAWFALFVAVLPLVAALVSDVVPGFVQLVGAVTPVLQLVGVLIAALAPFVAVLLGVLVPAVKSLAPVLQAAASLLISVVTAALQIVRGVLEVATGVLSGDWGHVWSGLTTIMSSAWSLVTGLVSGVIALVVAVVRGALANLGRLWRAAWGPVREPLTSIDGLLRTAEDGFHAVTDSLDGIGASVVGALSGARNWLVSVGSNIVEGFVEGAKAMTQRIADAVLGPIKDSVEGVKDFLGIHSPSRVMCEHAVGAASDALRESPDWVSASEIDWLAPRSFVESITDGVQGRGDRELAFELSSTGSVKGDLEAIDFLLRTQQH